VTPHPLNTMSSFRYSCFVFATAFVLASCGEPEKPRAAAINANAAPVGSSFDQVGKVGLYLGESCTSQIMFVFHSGRSTSISLAAPFRVSRILTDAAHDYKTVHVWGNGGAARRRAALTLKRRKSKSRNRSGNRIAAKAAQSSIPVMFGLEWSFDRNAEVIGLCFAEFS